MGNLFIYPNPKTSYKDEGNDPTLLYVPNKIEQSYFGSFFCAESRYISAKIPCRFIPCQTSNSPYLILFFHGNSEDIGPNLSHFLFSLSERFSINTLCPEYPSYGIYKTRDTSLSMDEAILQDAKRVIKFCHHQLKFKYENIIIMGRSLGSAVAVRLATQFNVRGVVLISPFTSIRDMGKRLVGQHLSMFAPDIFKSIDYIHIVKRPILLIHGESDALVPYEMSCKLYDKAVAPKVLRINQTMTHNNFRMETDLCLHVEEFMRAKLEMKEHVSTLKSGEPSYNWLDDDSQCSATIDSHCQIKDQEQTTGEC